MTTPSTSVAGMAGYVAPPLGLPLPDFSSWSLPPTEAPLPQGLPAASQGLSCVGRSIQVRAVVERQAWAQLAQGPRGLVPHTPHMAPPLHQPPPGWLSTPYKQAVQLPSQSSRRGVTLDSPMDETCPAPSQSVEDHGRQRTRERGGKGRSTSHPGVQEETGRQPPHQEGDLPSRSMPSVPPPAAPERTLAQLGSRPRTLPRDPTWLATKYHSAG